MWNKKKLTILAVIASIIVISVVGGCILFDDDKTEIDDFAVSTETEDIFDTTEIATEVVATEEIATEVIGTGVTQENTLDEAGQDSTFESENETSEVDSKTESGSNNNSQTQETQGPSTSESTPSSESESSSESTTSSEKEERHFKCQYWETEFGDFVPYKYGVMRSLVRDIEYYEYSDGTSEQMSVYEYYEYDCSGYNATDADLKAEAESVSASHMDYYNEVLRLTNEVRAEAGVEPLTLDTTLCKAATMRSLEMDYAQIFSHTRPNVEGEYWYYWTQLFVD